MTAADIRKHQLSGCPESVANDIVRLSLFVFYSRDCQKNEDVRQTAMVLVLLGHSAATAIRHARAQAARDLRPAGYVCIDSKLCGHIAAPRQERIAEMGRWRRRILDVAEESLLAILADGAAALAGRIGHGGKKVGKRRAQQIVKKLIKRVEAGEDLLDAARAVGLDKLVDWAGGEV